MRTKREKKIEITVNDILDIVNDILRQECEGEKK